MKYDISEDYDVLQFMNFLYNSSSYEELKMKCDINLMECIINKHEFDQVYAAHHKLDEHEVTV